MIKQVFLTFAAALFLPLATEAAPFGDWSTGATDDGLLFAGSVNESGGVLMKACNPASGYCTWYLVTSTRCDRGQTAPALFSTSMGAFPFQLTCDTSFTQNGTRMYRAVVGSPDTMDALLDSSRPLGIAVALEDGRFTVFRFSMAGGKRAVEVLMQGASKLTNSGQRGTRDSSL